MPKKRQLQILFGAPRSRWMIFILGGLMGPFLMITGIIVGYQIAVLSELECNQKECHLVQTRYLGAEKKSWRLLQIKEAYLDTHQSEGDTTYAIKVRLHSSDKEIKITPSYTDDFKERDAFVKALNTFVKAPSEETLHLRDDQRLMGTWVGFFVCFVGLGACLPLFSKPAQLSIDKANRIVKYRPKGFLNQVQKTFALHNLESVEVAPVLVPSYALILKFKYKKQLKLYEYPSQELAEQQAQSIRDFLA